MYLYFHLTDTSFWPFLVLVTLPCGYFYFHLTADTLFWQATVDILALFHSDTCMPVDSERTVTNSPVNYWKRCYAFKHRTHDFTSATRHVIPIDLINGPCKSIPATTVDCTALDGGNAQSFDVVLAPADRIGPWQRHARYHLTRWLSHIYVCEFKVT